MLVPDNIHPRQSIYANGAFVLMTMSGSPSWEVMELYARVRRTHEISLPVFFLSLDWLFLLNIIDVNGSGEVVRCS